MNLTPVNSSQINAIGYAPATNTLRIEFKGGSLYEYANVPPDLFEAFAKAPSIGSFFYKNIKNAPDKYPYVKLEANKAVDAPAPEVSDESVAAAPAEATESVTGTAPDTTIVADDPAPTSGEEATLEEHEQPGGGGL